MKYNLFLLFLISILNVNSQKITLFNEQYYVDESIKNKLYYHTAKSKNSGFTLENLGDRVAKYMPIIEPILNKYNIPNDFKYLAVAESGLSNVVSPVGAGGVWQIMPQTGRSLGLTVNTYQDDRNNIILATHAACNYLLKSYKVFKNWTLVAASYNCGVGCISSEIRQNQTRNYFKMDLNKETSDYIYRIIACKILLENGLNNQTKTPTKHQIKSNIEEKISIKIDSINVKDSIIENESLKYLYSLKLKLISEKEEFQQQMKFLIQKNDYIEKKIIVSTAVKTKERYYFTINGIDISENYKDIIIKVYENNEEGIAKENIIKLKNNCIFVAKAFKI